MSRRRLRFVGTVVVIAVILGAAALLLRPSVMPPPGPELASAPAAASPQADWPRTFTGGLGEQITLPGPARRIVTLGPNLDEMLCAIGAGDCLAGVSEYSKYPAEVTAKPKVGGLINPDMEKILALTPDLVAVARGTDRALVERMGELGLRVLTFDPQSLNGVLEAVEQLGRACGREQGARRLGAELRSRREATAARLAGLGKKPRVLLVIAWEGLFVAGGGGFGQDLIAAAGGVNAVTLMKGLDAGKPWLTVTRELVVVSDPELIVFAGADASPGGAQGDPRGWLRRDPAWAGLTAVKRGAVAQVDADLLTIPGPRLFEGLEQLAELVLQSGKMRPG